MKYLFFWSTSSSGCFYQTSINMILILLMNETHEIQEAILALAEKNVKGNNKKTIANKTNLNNNQGKQKQIADFVQIAKRGFNNILSIIFSQYNPTSIELSDDYYWACHIIKFFKYLCEDHNPNFHQRIMTEIEFSIGNNQSIHFYDMMLFILDKVITISAWETAKYDNEVHDYFYGLFKCIIEMLIEIVQGSDPSNFKVWFKEDSVLAVEEVLTTEGKNDFQEYETGKALRTFLNNIKTLIFDDISDSDTIFNVRKDWMDFLLAFMEEHNCPWYIKELIMSYYHPSMIIKSICNVLKKYYLSEISFKDNKSLFVNEENFKRDRTNVIIDQNFKESEIKKKLLNTKLKTKRWKQLKFNDDICTWFTQIYFEDPKFSQTNTFDLTNAFYNYFIWTYIQYKNEESTDFWNKVHNQSKEVLDVYNKRTKISNSLDVITGPINDDSEFEAYYVIKFFKEVSKHVLVKIKPEVPPIYVVYTIHPYSRYWSSDSKFEFLKKVDRKNRYTKWYDWMESSEYFRLEIVYNWNNLRRSAVLKKSTELNYHMIGYFTFFAAFCMNCVILASLHESGEGAYGSYTLGIVRVVSYIWSSWVVVIIIFWFLTKLKLYYEIEKAKYKENHKEKKGIPDSQLTFSDKFKIRYQAIVGKGELTPFFFFLIFTILGAVTTDWMFFYSFSLLSVVSWSQTLNNIALSIFVKGRQLMWTSLFTLVLLYVYAGWGFYYQRDRYYDTEGRDVPDHMCKSLIYCFLTQINNGWRWHPGVGKVVRSESGLYHLGPFIHRFWYDWLFFWLLEAAMLHIVFGIIIDSFGELRQAHYIIEKDIANNCFICNIVKDECEKNNKSFEEHCTVVHNLWDYAFYMITLRMKDPQDLNAINSRCREWIMEKGLSWLPDYNLDKDDCESCEND